jgi:hypothetical protein
MSNLSCCTWWRVTCGNREFSVEDKTTTVNLVVACCKSSSSSDSWISTTYPLYSQNLQTSILTLELLYSFLQFSRSDEPPIWHYASKSAAKLAYLLMRYG